VREIARATGLSQAGRLHYFTSKEELFTEVLRRRDERNQHLYERRQGEHVSPDGLVAIVRHNAAEAGLVRLYVSMSAESTDVDSEARAYFVARYDTLRAKLADGLRHQQEEGTFAADLDAEVMASLLVAAVDGLQVQWLLDPDNVDMGERIAQLWQALQRVGERDGRLPEQYHGERGRAGIDLALRFGHTHQMSAARIQDVAGLAGVSIGTVSNVLNRPDIVRVATRRRVEQAIAELSYVPNGSARQLKAGRSRVLAYVALDTANPFFSDVARGVEEATRQADLSLFLCNSGQDLGRETEYLRDLVELGPRGVLITPVDTSTSHIQDLRDRGIAVVLVDRVLRGSQWCAVGVDDVLGGELAVEHLIERGHRRIAFVGGPAGLTQVEDRRAGAARAVEQAGLDPTALTVVVTGSLTFADGRVAGARLLGMSHVRRPTAVFCANDLVAVGLLQHLALSGVRVPDDIALIGYDDIEYAASAAVPLSSVAQPRHELGRAAARLLLDEADNPAQHIHEQVVFKPELVARESTAR
jgi:LacI family transcriptional regulator